jgi:putative ABC transport system ATP-binding protein
VTLASTLHDPQEVLALSDVTKSYGPDPGKELLHLTDISFHRGDYVSIMGRSGSGKTTLLNLIGLLDLPTGGDDHPQRC